MFSVLGSMLLLGVPEEHRQLKKLASDIPSGQRRRIQGKQPDLERQQTSVCKRPAAAAHTNAKAKRAKTQPLESDCKSNESPEASLSPVPEFDDNEDDGSNATDASSSSTSSSSSSSSSTPRPAKSQESEPPVSVPKASERHQLHP